MKEENSNSILGLMMGNIALWGVIAFLIFVIFPIAIKLEEPYQAVLISLGTSLFVALTITYFANKKISSVTNYEVKELIQKHFPRLLQMNELGLDKITYNNNMQSLGIDITHSAELFIVMNDGRNFFTNNSKELFARFKEPDKKTVIILLSDTSTSENILNKRNNKEEQDHYARKIRASIKEYRDLHNDSNPPEDNKLEIYKHDYSFTMSIVATSEFAILGTYRNAASKSLVPPHFIFNNVGAECEYQNIKIDIFNLIKQSTLVPTKP